MSTAGRARQGDPPPTGEDKPRPYYATKALARLVHSRPAVVALLSSLCAGVVVL